MSEPGVSVEPGRRRGRRADGADIPMANPSLTPAAATVGAASLLFLCEQAGAVFLLLAVALGIAVLLWGWPDLVRSPDPTGTRLGIATTAAAAMLFGASATDGPAMTHLPPAIALGAVVSWLRPVARGAITDVIPAITTAAGAILLVASGMAMAILPDLRGIDRPLTLAMCGVVLGVFADLMPPRWRGHQLLLTALLGAAGGALATWLVPTSAAIGVGALLGAVASVVATAVRIAVRELPRAQSPTAASVTAAAAVLAPGTAVFTIARLLLG